MSKEDFVQLFETPAASGSASQASILERTTIATLVCASLASMAGVVLTLVEGQGLLSLTL